MAKKGSSCVKNDKKRAELFAACWKDQLWWVPEKGWLYYNGEVWERLSGDRAIGVYLSRFDKLIDMNFPNGNEKLKGSLLTVSKAKSTLVASKSLLELPFSKWDESPRHKCVKNGVLDLETETLLPFSKETRSLHLVSQLPVDYVKGASCPLWEEFMESSIGDKEVVNVMQKACGYSLTGYTKARLLFFCYGPTGTGKSTFLNILRRVSGEAYSVVTPAHVLMSNKRTQGSDLTPHLANLIGKRVGWVEEVSMGDYWEDAAVKRLVSEDRLSGTAKYQNPCDFTPTHKLWIAGNSKPILRINDPAVLARLMLVDMVHCFSGKGCIPGYARKMWEKESEGILAWMIAGAKKWKEEGFGAWNDTRLGTNLKEYRSEFDAMGRFCKEALTEGWGEQEVLTQNLVWLYESWCEVLGEYQQGPRTLIKYLKEHYKVKRVSKGWRVLGVKLCLENLPEKLVGPYRLRLSPALPTEKGLLRNRVGEPGEKKSLEK